MKKLEKGAATFTVLIVLHDGSGGDTKKRIEKARGHSAKDPRQNGAASASGFASGTAVMESEINEANSVFDGVLKLHYRTIQKKVVPSMLRALIEKMEAEAREDNDGKLTRKERKQIKLDARDMLEKDAPYTIREIEIVFQDRLILIGSTAKKDVEVIERALSSYMDILTEAACPSAPETSFCRQEFFTWLMNGEKKIWNHDDMKTPIETSFAGAVEFLSNIPDEDIKKTGCTKATIDGPCVSESDELRVMRKNRKTIARAKIHLSDGRLAWTFTFDAEHWKFRSVKLTGTYDNGLSTRGHCLSRLYEIMRDLFDAWHKEREREEGTVDMFDEAEKKQKDARKGVGTMAEAFAAAENGTAVKNAEKQLKQEKRRGRKAAPK